MAAFGLVKDYDNEWDLDADSWHRRLMAQSETEKWLGKGRVLHFGAAFTRDSVRQLLDYTGALEPFAGVVDAPEEIQVVMREKDGVRVSSGSPRSVPLYTPCKYRL